MKFGVCLPNFPFGVKPSREAIVGIAQAAERLNYDSVWFSDHVLVPKDKPRYGRLYEVLTTMAYVAGMTQHIYLGTSVLVLPQRDAILAAKQIATLDDLSGGRVIIGVGVGWIEGEYKNLGADFQRRGRHLNEAMQVMKTLWQEDDPQFEGEFYNFRDVLFNPKPAQPGGPPIWVGGSSEAAIRRIATLGDGWNADDAPLEQLQVVTAQLRQLTAENGRSVEISLRRTVDLRPAAAEAGLLAEPTTGGGVDQAGRWPGGTAGALTGSLSEVKDFMNRVAEIGVSHFIFQFEHNTQEEHLAQLEFFAKAGLDL
ncbi:MAG: TIGR03619 family F420-dependent LLM class oxidoreductase [Chloroflexi bacterium]|nr:TIGR03619 family F420-dependent LLM class oxidoreductase [Chloroflexota bacterium]